MNVKLVRISIEQAEKLWSMQVREFWDLYEKYQDTDTSPATESIDIIQMKLNQPHTYFYFIEADDKTVGAIRVVDEHKPGKPKRISPLFVMQEYRNRGFAQKAIKLAEEIHGCSNWGLDTVLQEKRKLLFIRKNGLSPNRKKRKDKR